MQIGHPCPPTPRFAPFPAKTTQQQQQCLMPSSHLLILVKICFKNAKNPTKSNKIAKTKLNGHTQITSMAVANSTDTHKSHRWPWQTTNQNRTSILQKSPTRQAKTTRKQQLNNKQGPLQHPGAFHLVAVGPTIRFGSFLSKEFYRVNPRPSGLTPKAPTTG